MSHSQENLKLVTFLPQAPEFWEYSQESHTYAHIIAC